MLLERFHLWDARSQRAGSFSRGMLQRLALCRAFLHEPDLYLLDEPFSGLDEAGVELLDRELAERREHGTFLVATPDPARLAPLDPLQAFPLFCSGLDGPTVAAAALADVGICFVGSFVAAMSIATRARELLLPLLFLPLAIPIVIGGVGASVASGAGRYLALLALYDLVFAILCWASFEYVVTE